MIRLLKRSFFNLFFMIAPHKAQVEVAANAVKANPAAKRARAWICPEIEDRKVEYNVSP